MQSNFLISVVVPMYNAERFIAKCLEHLIHQTYKNLEIIIVDDGSKDGSVAICNKYAANDKRIKIISQKNAGPSVALNTGMAAAHGEYIHFHDHDDFVNLDYFEIMAHAAELTGADILCGEVNQPEYNFPRFAALEICTDLRDKVLKTAANKFNPAWRYLYKKSFLDKTGLKYEPDVFGAQDLYFTKPAIVLADSVTLVPGAVYNVVNTDTALGKSRKKLRTAAERSGARAAHARYCEFMAQHGATEIMSTPEQPLEVQELRLFNKCISKRVIFQNKIRYYFLGINIATRRLIRE